MVGSSCYVPGCKIGYRAKLMKPDGTKLHLFSVPKDRNKFEKWKNAIPRGNRELTPNDKICELHFKEDEVIKFFVTKLPDGTTHSIRRGNCQLKPDAVPSIFLPYVFRTVAMCANIKTESPPESDRIPEKENEEVLLPISNFVKEEIIDDEFSFSELVRNIDKVKMPNDWWAVTKHSKFIVCVKWDEGFAAERQIIIDSNLSVRVLYYGRTASGVPNLTLDSMECMSSLLNTVNECVVCPSAIDGYKDCCIYIQRQWAKPGRPQIWCTNCRKLRSTL